MNIERILIVPGLRNSGPAHWQTWFESQLPDTRRVEEDNWERPSLSGWSSRVESYLDEAIEPVWIVAHSFGCLASVTAGLRRPEKILGALLVAPADPVRFGEPVDCLEARLAFPSLVVASSNDPWVKASVAEYWAGQWGSGHLGIGEAGHINIDSGHGPWPDGLAIFRQFQAVHYSQNVVVL